MTADTPIPAEALQAAHRAAAATWHVMATTGHRQAVEAAVRAAAPILLAAGCTAADVLAENERLRVDLAHWMSGRRTRGIPPPATVPDGLTYAAQLVRAQGTEGGEDHDRLLREASMRLKALHDLASRQQDELVWLRQDRDAALAAGRTAAPEPCPLEHVCDDESPCGCWCDLHDVRMDECPTFRLVTGWLADAEKRARTAAAADIREAAYPDPSPCIPAWHKGYVEAWFRAARIAENGADHG